MIQEYPTKLFFRKKGLPATFKNVEGLLHQFDAQFSKLYYPTKVKTLIFKNRLTMRKFYANVLPKYRNFGARKADKLELQCRGLVSNLMTDWYRKNKKTGETETRTEVDRNYFALVLLTQDRITQEVLTHEAVHVGFAWDWRTLGEKVWLPRADVCPEERICYPAGWYADQVMQQLEANPHLRKP